MSAFTDEDFRSVEEIVDNFFEENNLDELDYRDNFRYAFKDNPEQVAEYEKAEAQGCCGFYDVEITLPDGRILMFGFNYGH